MCVASFYWAWDNVGRIVIELHALMTTHVNELVTTIERCDRSGEAMSRALDMRLHCSDMQFNDDPTDDPCRLRISLRIWFVITLTRSSSLPDRRYMPLTARIILDALQSLSVDVRGVVKNKGSASARSPF